MHNRQKKLKKIKKTLDFDLGANITAEETVEMADLFCTLKFKRKTQHNSEEEKVDALIEDDAAQHQERVARRLAGHYDHGHAELGISRDPWRARKYGRRKYPPTKKRTENIYEGLRLLTSFRLFILRANRIADYVNTNWFLNTVCKSATDHISTITNIAGISYAIELLADFAVLARTIFFPTKKEEKNNPSALSRVKNTLKKDNRIPRMANAAVWFGVNMAGFFITAGLSAILNISLFAFDVCNDTYKAWRDRSKHVRFEKAIQTKKTAIIDKMVNTQDNPTQYNALDAELNKYDLIEKRIEENKRTVMNKRYYAIAISIVLLIGMSFVLFPPAGAAATVLAWKMVGASLAMSGSIFGGFGKSIFDKATAPKEEVEMEELTEHAAPVQHIPHMLPPPAHSPALRDQRRHSQQPNISGNDRDRNSVKAMTTQSMMRTKTRAAVVCHTSPLPRYFH